MQKSRLPAVAVLWLGTTAIVFAANTDRPEKPIIVTATRTAQTADASLASVTVITRRILNASRRGLSRFIARCAGINISNNGGAGKTTSVSCAAPNPIMFWS